MKKIKLKRQRTGCYIYSYVGINGRSRKIEIDKQKDSKDWIVTNSSWEKEDCWIEKFNTLKEVRKMISRLSKGNFTE